jgi:hypothetical protein
VFNERQYGKDTFIFDFFSAQTPNFGRQLFKKQITRKNTP